MYVFVNLITTVCRELFSGISSGSNTKSKVSFNDFVEIYVEWK